MEWFRNLKISGKLGLAFTLLILLMAFLGWAGYMNVVKVAGQMEQFYQVQLPSLDYLLQVDRDLQQLMVAERSLLATASADPRFETLVQQYEENLKQSEERWGLAKALLPAETTGAICARYEKARQAWSASSRQVLDYCRQDSPEARQSALALSMGDAAKLFEDMRTPIDQLTELLETTAAREAEAARQRVGVTVLYTLILFALGLLVAVGGGWFLSRAIIGPLRRALNLAEEIANGDLSHRLHMKHKDETGRLGHMLDVMADNLTRHAELAEKVASGDLSAEVSLVSDRDQFGKALQTMTARLSELVLQVQTAVGQISVGSEQVSGASQTLSQGATESAASLEEITASMTQMASQTKLTAQNAEQANSLSKGSRNAAARGDKLMQELVEAMSEIDRSGQDINKIIKVIDEIAFQTNLLALNAAVEAARAGQHGKGFAVVAEEVRNLAARSAKAAKETAQLIENSAEKTRNGNSIADKTAAAFKGIVAGAAKVTDLVGEIAAAATEQASGIEQVNRGLDQIDRVTQQNTAHAEESAAAAEELSGQAGQLKELVGRFKVRGAARSFLPTGKKLPPSRSGQLLIETSAQSGKPAREESRMRSASSTSTRNQRPQGTARAAAVTEATAKKATDTRTVVAPLSANKKQDLKPEEVIALDDTEFGRY
jgi:methyl-accepting chemotaxis protein